jgi:hypothetical protein
LRVFGEEMMSFRFSQKIRAQGPGASMDQAIGKCKGEKKARRGNVCNLRCLLAFIGLGLFVFNHVKVDNFFKKI